jgi:hypothetical protein
MRERQKKVVLAMRQFTDGGRRSFPMILAVGISPPTERSDGAQKNLGVCPRPISTAFPWESCSAAAIQNSTHARLNMGSTESTLDFCDNAVANHPQK